MLVGKYRESVRSIHGNKMRFEAGYRQGITYEDDQG